MALRDTTEKVGMGRVLIVTTSYPLTKSTASGVFVRDLVNAIADRDAEVYVVCPDNDCSVQTDAFVHPVRYAVCRHWQTLTHGPGGCLLQLGIIAGSYFLCQFYCCVWAGLYFEGKIILM